MADNIYKLSADDTLYFPFNAHELPDGSYDRVWDSSDFAEYYYLFIGNGIYPNPSTNLQVRSLYNNMIVSVGAGAAMLKGYGYRQRKEIDIIIPQSNPALRRIDDIVVRLDKPNRIIAIVHREGIASATPTVPTLIRNDDIFELRLAEITINAGAFNITATNIKDTRLDGNVCGIVTQMVQSVDTTTLFKQYDKFLAEKILEWITFQNEQELQWQTQTNVQQSTWQTQKDQQKTAWQTWFDSLKIDLERYAAFNFDNLNAMPGVEVTLNPAAGTETIKIKSTNITLATRTTVFNANGTDSITEVLYASDGVTILRGTTTTVTYNADGSITGVVV